MSARDKRISQNAGVKEQTRIRHKVIQSITRGLHVSRHIGTVQIQTHVQSHIMKTRCKNVQGIS